jgi:hypothetical protein
MQNNPSVSAENAKEGEGMQNTPIADNIARERTEAAAESAAEGAEIFTEVTTEMVAEEEGNAAENALHSASEFMEGISDTQEEDGTDHTIRIEEEAKEGTYEFNTGEEAVMEAVSQIPESELEAMARWIVNLAQQEGILEFKVLAAAGIPERKRRIQERFRALREVEDKCTR